MKRFLIAFVFAFAFLLPPALAQRPSVGGQIVGVSGNGNTSVTSAGAQTPGACVVIDANGNHIAGLCNAARNHQSQLAGVLANGTDKTLFTYSVPANTMGAAGCIHAEFAFQQSAGGGTPKFWFGSTAVTIYPGSGDTNVWITSVRVCNNAGATGVQQIVANVVAYAGANFVSWSGGVFNTSAQDTTAAVVMKLTGTGGTSNIFTPVDWTVW
jgi:hypothetical protein